MLQKIGKVDFRKPAGATPHGHVAFVRFGAESCAKKSAQKTEILGGKRSKHTFAKKNKKYFKISKVDVKIRGTC